MIYWLVVLVVVCAVWQHFGWPGSVKWKERRQVEHESERWLRAPTAALVAESPRSRPTRTHAWASVPPARTCSGTGGYRLIYAALEDRLGGEKPRQGAFR